MKVGVDFSVVDGKYQGSRTHVLSLFEKVVELAPEIEMFFFIENVEWLKNYSVSYTLPNVTIVKLKKTSAIRRVVYELPKKIAQYQLDILHTQYVVPLFCGKKSMVTIHDILFEDYPAFFTTIFNIRSKIFIRHSARSAAHVFTVSNYSRDRIVDRYKISNDKITVIQNAVSSNSGAKNIDDSNYLLNKRGIIEKEYILMVGRIEPRKNHASLIKAYFDLPEKKFPLVIVGQYDFGVEKLNKICAGLIEKGLIKIFSDVSEVELAMLYECASIFIYPSKAEGFGLPPLEAMSHGVPVITSKGTALEELAKDYAILVDPNSITEITRELARLIESEELRKHYSELSLLRAKDYVWSSSAHAVVAQYKKYKPV